MAVILAFIYISTPLYPIEMKIVRNSPRTVTIEGNEYTFLFFITETGLVGRHRLTVNDVTVYEGYLKYLEPTTVNRMGLEIEIVEFESDWIRIKVRPD